MCLALHGAPSGDLSSGDDEPVLGCSRDRVCKACRPYRENVGAQSGGIEGAVSVGVCVVYCCQHTMLYIYGVAYPTWDVALR